VRLIKFNDEDIFGDAMYAINLGRQEKLRMPEQKAQEIDVTMLSQYINQTISRVSSEYNFIGKHEYIELRDSICARLTLFNARRGGELSRLKLSNYCHKCHK